MYSLKHTFFCPSLEDGYLSQEESNHVIRVLRLKENDQITLINGKGRKVTAQITVADKRQVQFSILSDFEEKPRQIYVHIGIAPTKSMDRFQFFIEKATEIGIDRITPILTSNSERKVLNREKILKSTISALKQSGNLFLPEIDEMRTFADFLTEKRSNSKLFIAHCESDNEKKELKNELNNTKFVTILIGPEGDFTPEEIKLAKEKKWNPISLGDTRLRTETAGIVACHTVSIISSL